MASKRALLRSLFFDPLCSIGNHDHGALRMGIEFLSGSFGLLSKPGGRHQTSRRNAS